LWYGGLLRTFAFLVASLSRDVRLGLSTHFAAVTHLTILCTKDSFAVMSNELAGNIPERPDVAKENASADYAVEYAIRRPAHRPQARDIARPKSQQEQRRLQRQRMPRQKAIAFHIREKLCPRRMRPNKSIRLRSS
jgi:hypothetical protein